jgi:hypothetical protein
VIALDCGNVLLKPSHRRQIHSHLRRITRLGQRLGNFVLNLTLRREGRSCIMSAQVRDSAGSFTCRSRRQTWRDALREMIRLLSSQLHRQRLQAAVASI